ncbi:MAG: amidase family protein [Chloroflexota bacterium]|nr:amidase family protein [Chloroflexota bacterium]
MTSLDICWMTATELSRAISEKELSPVDVVKAILERIEVINPKINAYVTVNADLAIEAAKQAEDAVMKNEAVGPLHGVPVSIKDLIFTKDMRTTMGSRLMEHFIPEEDAVAVARLKEAGAIVLGKTNTSEFGLKTLTDNLVFGVTRNPWCLERTCGGSSGGAAAAVASGLGPLAVGTDGGGSIRIPSSCCGVFGLKPQFGRIPRYPAFPTSSILVHEGTITRTVEDAALMLNTIVGYHWGDSCSVPAPCGSFADTLGGGVKGLKIAWSPDLEYAAVDPEIREVCEHAAKKFIDMGAEVEKATPGLSNPQVYIESIFRADMLATLSVFGSVDQIVDKLDPLTAKTLHLASQMKASDYARAIIARQELSSKMGKFFQTYDLLLTPTLTEPPPCVDFIEPLGFLGWMSFTNPFNFTGQPAASIPAGWTKDGLPIGLQIVGRAYDEATVLQAAAAFEKASPWKHVTPPLD